MTEQPGSKAPAAPPPSAPPPTPEAGKPALDDDGKRAKVGALRAEADELEKTLPPAADTVQLRVEEPHEAFGYGGSWVNRQWTAIRSHLVPGIMQSASEAGVKITQKEG